MAITTDLDLVRLRVGDTDEDDPLLYDDEITAFLTAHTVLDPDTDAAISVNIPAAAADCAGAISAKFARDFNFAEDGQTFQRAQRVGHYLALEQQLRAMAGGVSVPVTNAGTVTT